MHELGFAEQILNCVEEEARRHGARKALRVKLRMGKYSGLEKASLFFCLEAISAGTLMEGAEIEIEETAAEWFCANCGRYSSDGYAEPICPACGGKAVLTEGMELYVKEIELDDDEG
ncbi:MAG: hydrogenase maturation nickel metallochaperone HypA [Candidatus Omnitrophota bacterium]